MTLHDELRELVEAYGPDLLLDPEQFRAALDDYVDEGSAFPGQLNLLHDAVRFGALNRCLEMLDRGGDPAAVVQMAGDVLARERGTLEVASARWAVATLAHAMGRVDRGTLEVFAGTATTESPPTPDSSVPSHPLISPPSAPPPAPTAMPPSMPPPSAPPPSSPPPTAPPPTAPPPTAAPPGAPPKSLPAEPAPAEPAPPQSVPAESLPAESLPAESLPAESLPAESAPDESAPAEPPPPSMPQPFAPPTAAAAASVPPPARAESDPAPPAPPPPGAEAAGTALAPPSLPRVPGQPPPPSGPPDRPSRRKGVALAVVAVVLLALVGVGAYALVSGSDDPDDTAKDPGGSTTSESSPSAPETSETTQAPPEPPGRPKLTTDPAYRSVVFTLGGSVVDEDGVTLEALVDGEWTTTKPSFKVPTDKGGQQVCARARAVRVDGDQRAAGPVEQACGKSEPPSVKLLPSDISCDAAAGPTCRTFVLSVAGFEAKSSYEMRVLGALQPSGTFDECVGECTKTFRTDGQGKAKVKKAAGGFVGQEIRVQVEGITATIKVS